MLDSKLYFFKMVFPLGSSCKKNCVGFLPSSSNQKVDFGEGGKRYKKLGEKVVQTGDGGEIGGVGMEGDKKHIIYMFAILEPQKC